MKTLNELLGEFFSPGSEEVSVEPREPSSEELKQVLGLERDLLSVTLLFRIGDMQGV